MTFKPQTPKVSKGHNMSMLELVGQKMKQKASFVGTKVEITKLSITQVNEIQELVEKQKGDDNANDMDLLIDIIKMSVAEASELSEEDFNSFPLDEVVKLSNEIMKFSGMDPKAGK